MTTDRMPQLDDELREEARICKQGVETPFWEVVKRRLGNLQAQAVRNLVKVPPSNMGEIAELQKTVQVADIIIADIEDTAKLT